MAKQGVNVVELGLKPLVPVLLTVFQESDLGGLGPLQLSILSVTQGLNPNPRASVRKRISDPLRSIIEGNTFDGYVGDDAFWGGAGLPYAGSIVVETQTGSVARRWAADLVSGTYQIPACDSVRVSVWAMANSAAQEGTLVVTAAVRPANASMACKPWLWTAQAAWQSTGGDFVLPQISIPEGAMRYRVGMSVAHVPAGNPADYAALPMEAATITGMSLLPPGIIPESYKFQQGGWYELSYIHQFVKVLYSNISTNAVSLYPWVQFEIEP